MEFRDRLKLAAKHANVEYGSTTMGRSLGLRKQTVERWMGVGLPSLEMLYLIADKWEVDPRWLATGNGDSKLDGEKWTPQAAEAEATAPRIRRVPLSSTLDRNKSSTQDAKVKRRTSR